MGNWRTVHLIGTCDPDEVPALQEACRMRPDLQGFHPLTDAAGICGLNDWPAAEIDRRGNLAERNYSIEEVAATLLRLAQVAPSLTLKAHCGGENESKTVAATILVARRSVIVMPPLIAEIAERTDAEMQRGLVYALQQARARRWAG